MKINKQTFNLNEELIVSIEQEDNDGLINIPKNINLDINIVNYFGKIVINSISINHLQDELSLSKTGLEQSLSNLDIKFPHTKKNIDEKAAAFILQGASDFLNN